VSSKEKVDLLLGQYQSENTLYENFEKVVAASTQDGLFLEFGVATGQTIRRIASHHAGKVYGFDSFKGLPEDWRPGIGVGSFVQEELPIVPENVELVVGLFQDTLDDFLSKNKSHVSFCHLDADLYSSTSYILEKLKDRFVDGTVLVFDEFHNYPGFEEHEYKAFIEFLNDTDYDVEFLGKWHPESSIFKLVKK
jgi:hypothetical protein